MIEIVAIVILIAVLASHRALASRVSALEEKLKSGVQPAAGAPAPVASPQTAGTVVNGGMEEYVGQQGAAPATTPVAPAGAKQPDGFERFGAWLKEDWLMKLGGFLFIIGCGWFVSYAFANNWIGPVGRISIGIIAGALIMVFGFWRMLRFPSQGAVFMAIGAGMAMLSIYAGRAVYDFFTPTSAVLFDFIIAAFVSFASYRFNLRSLAFVAQVLAFAAPLLTAGQTDSVFLFSYLLAITVATLVLSGITGWRNLIFSSLVFVGLYSLPYIFSPGGLLGSRYYTDAPTILTFAYIFAMIYLLVDMFAVMRGKVDNVKNEILLAVLNGLFLFGWIYNVADKEWQVLIFASWAIVFAAGSFIAFRFSSVLQPFYAYGSVAIAFVAAATAAELNGTALAIAFSVEALVIVTTVLALTKRVRSASTALLLFIVPWLYSVTSAQNYLNARELFTKDFFVLVVLSLALIGAGRMIGNVERESQSTAEGNKAWVAAVIFGTMYLWFTLWCYLHILLIDTPDMATLATLTVYTVAGVWTYFVGLNKGSNVWRLYGAIMLVVVVARLLFVDVWSMELFGRVVTFFAIGILLMSTAFLTRKKQQALPTV